MSTLVLDPFQIFPADEIPRNGLAAEYLANNNTLDTSGNGYDGLPTDITYGDFRHGEPNSAFVLNGTTSFVDIDAAIPGIIANSEGTFSAWVKPVDATPPADQFFLSFGNSVTNTRIHKVIKTTGQYELTAVNVGVVEWNKLTTASSVSDGVWTHLATVKIGSLVKLYVGGIFVTQSFSVENDPTVWFSLLSQVINRGRIGCLNALNLGNVGFFEGLMSKIRLYDRPLSQAEITALANE